MARLNIEDDLWKDGRFLRLAVRVGDHFKAVGMVVMAWSVAQKYWLNGERPIPRPVFDRELDPVLIEMELAEVSAEGDVYIRGSREQFAWLVQRREAGRSGGLRSGKTRLETIKEKTKRNEAEASGTKRGEPSYSLSISEEEKNVGSATPPDAPYDFETLYRIYPKRGKDMGKRGGMDKLRSQITSPAKYDDFARAVKNYSAHCAKEKRKDPGWRFSKMWSSFCARNFWPDWVDQQEAQPPAEEYRENTWEQALGGGS